MSITLIPWNDNENCKREIIIFETKRVLSEYYTDFAFLTDITVRYKQIIHSGCCLEYPCTCPDRSNICIEVKDRAWCQFVHQFSHELCHCITSNKTLPQKVKWFDEFICCFTSYFVEKIFSVLDSNALTKLYPNYNEVFADYVLKEQKGHIYSLDNPYEFFASNRQSYEQDENLIKKHDYFMIKYYDDLKGNFEGLTFIGKLWNIVTSPEMLVEDYMLALNPMLNDKEKSTVAILKNVFGLEVSI